MNRDVKSASIIGQSQCARSASPTNNTRVIYEEPRRIRIPFQHNGTLMGGVEDPYPTQARGRMIYWMLGWTPNPHCASI